MALSAVTAFGHGSMADPLSRSYAGFLENPQTPRSGAIAAAIQIGGTQPFYDWHEVARNIPDYNYQANIPDGTLAGAGRDKYRGLNLARLDWPATKVVPGNYNCVFYAPTPHEPSFFRAFITKPGYNPLQTLKWSDLEVLAGAENAKLTGSNFRFSVNLPQRIGRHVLFVIWQRIDPAAEVFFSTSDLDFSGTGSPVATPTPQPTAIPSPTPQSTPVVGPSPTPAECPKIGGVCQCAAGVPVVGAQNTLLETNDVVVRFSVTNDWGSGFQGDITIFNKTTTPLLDWSLSMDLDREITSLYSARIVSRTGAKYIFDGATFQWNRSVAALGSVKFGFIASPGQLKTLPKNSVFTRRGEIVPPTPSPTASATPRPSASASPSPILGSPNTVFESTQFKVSFRVTSDWGNGFQTAVEIENKTALPLTNWTLRFVMDRTISSIWNARLASRSGNIQTFDAKTAAWNQTIPARGKINFGFVANTGNLKVPPTGFQLQASGLVSASPTPAPANGMFNYAEVLQKSFYFYEAQRSGKLPSNNRVAWRGDSALLDGNDVGVDLSGGYYDAGDHVKFALPMAGSMTLLAWGGIEYANGYQASGQKQALLSAVRWGTDWIMKASPLAAVFYGQVGNGAADHSYWGPPEKMTMPRPSYRIDSTKPGTEVVAESAAALASAYLLFKDEDPAYAERLLAKARGLFDFADQFRGSYTVAIPDAENYYKSFSGYLDELVWAAVWMYRATGEARYLQKAESLYSENFGNHTLRWTHSWDDKLNGAVILLAQLTGKDIYKNAVLRWLDFWTVGIAGERVKYTPGGLAWLSQWGSLRYAATTSLLAFIYADKVGDVGTRYRDFAKRQINYMLGDNPKRRSFVVGFGNNPPRNPHHRAAHGSVSNNIMLPLENKNVIFGALVGGPSSLDDNSYVDDRTNYITNEVSLDYNAGFTGAIARMYTEFGGSPLAKIP